METPALIPRPERTLTVIEGDADQAVAELGVDVVEAQLCVIAAIDVVVGHRHDIVADLHAEPVGERQLEIVAAFDVVTGPADEVVTDLDRDIVERRDLDIVTAFVVVAGEADTVVADL